MEKFNQKAEQKQQELSQAEDEANNTDGNEEEKNAKAKCEELQVEAENQAELKNRLEVDLKKAQQPVKAKKQELKNAHREQKDADKAVKRARNALKDARDEIAKQAGSAESEAARRTQMLKEAEEEVAERKDQFNANRQAVATTYRAFEEQQPIEEQAKSHTATKASQLSAVKHKLEDLKKSGGSSLAVFGPRCEKVHRLVRYCIFCLC